jgi:hypothetical protein
LNGFVAFFAACNRHRLSTYNHIQEFMERVHGRTTRPESIDSRHGKSVKNNQRTVSFLSMFFSYGNQYCVFVILILVFDHFSQGDETRRKLHLA